MIWTENFNQVPAGNQVATVELSGRTYDVWTTSDNHYIAFVPTATAQGWFPSDSTLGQIGYGVEIVSTEGADATFEFTDFSITSN